MGISILSGSHLELVPEVLDRLRAAHVDAPVVVGGIIPPEDAEVLKGKGVAAVYTPRTSSSVASWTSSCHWRAGPPARGLTPPPGTGTAAPGPGPTVRPRPVGGADGASPSAPSTTGR